MKRLLFDTESDGFVAEATKVHCIAAADVDTGERFDWKPDQIPQALEVISQADALIAHNGQRHDIPLLTKLHNFYPRPGVDVHDTMIIARTTHPNVRDTDAELLRTGVMPKLGSDGKALIGRHTLEAWGYRLGEKKAPYNGGWESWSPVMHDYMIQDVTTNLKLWHYLNPDEYSQQALQLEHDIARICDSMEQDGVPFDITSAGQLHALLIGKKAEVEAKLKKQFGFWLAPISPTKHVVYPKKKPNKKQHHFFWEPDPIEETYIDKVKGSDGKEYVLRPCYSKLKRVEFNPGSRDHIAKVLKDRGWVPTEFTPSGKPEINEAVVAGAAAQYPECEGLADYLLLDKRLSQLADGDQAWLKVVKEDGRIHGVINPMGTGTSRASHFFPNLAQVPAVKSPYGKECRSLFYAPEPFVMVGADMEGLEGRGFAHYLHPLDGGDYAKALLAGDPHWKSTQVLGLVPRGTVRDKGNRLHVILREGAKRFYYAFIYGCWDLKAGELILEVCTAARKENPEWAYVHEQFFGKTMKPSEQTLRKVGRKAREAFIRETPGLEELTTKIKGMVQRKGWLPGLDKRRIPTKSEHSALNYLIQSAGAILCKRWGVDAVADLSSRYKKGWDGDFVPMLWVHDEYQFAARKGLEEEVGQTLVRHAQAAGQTYDFRVPLDSKYIVGKTWADTH